jgi:hypothetical protein
VSSGAWTPTASLGQNPSMHRRALPLAALSILLAASLPAPAAAGDGLGGWAGFFAGPTFAPDDGPIVWRLSGRGAISHRLAGPLSVDLGVMIDGGFSSQEGGFDSRARTRYLELGPLLRGSFALSDQLSIYLGPALAYVSTRTTLEVPIFGRSTHDASGFVIRILAGLELAISDEVRVVVEPVGLNVYRFDESQTDLWSVLIGASAMF